MTSKELIPTCPTIQDFTWTSSDESEISHIRIIDSGAGGEVHQLLDARSGKNFARKILRAFGPIKIDDVQNELRAVEKLCKGGTHKNIVEVIRLGVLSTSLYFLDMELCDLNLETWITRNWDERIKKKVPYFTVDLPSRMRIWHIRGIMEDVSSGIAFIHSRHEVHRDLKPRNILYSHEHEAWKIADFGLTSEGSSQKACSTRYSRGTPGYRAPELLREDGKYTNKVDIWALGCILYELVFETKAFQSDWDVQYSKCNDSLRERLRLLTETERNPDMTAKSFASKIMCEMLDIDPSKRPSAEQVHRIFSLGMDQSLCHSCKSLYEQCEELNQVDVQEFSRLEDEKQTDTITPYEGTNAVPLNQVGWNGSVRNIKANMPNTRIATVITKVHGAGRARVQQLWETSTGVQLWEHKHEEPHIMQAMFPSFSPDGRYVGFFNGTNAIILLDTISPSTVAEVDRIELDKIDAKRTDITHTRAFAIGPDAKRIALGAPFYNKSLASVYKVSESRTKSGRTVDAIPLKDSEIAPSMYYTDDGGTLFVISQNIHSSSTRKIKRFNLTSSKWMGAKELTNVLRCVEGCPVRLITKPNGNVEQTFPVELLKMKPSVGKFGTRWLGRGQELLEVLAISVIHSKIGCRLQEHQRMVVSQGRILFVDLSSGTVSTWQTHSPIRVVARFTPLPHNETDRRKDVQVVAFNGGRLILFSWNDMRFTFIDTDYSRSENLRVSTAESNRTAPN